jgi:HD-like signal output (HDOD) protein
LLLDHLPLFPRYLQQLQCVLEDSSTDLEEACATLREHSTIHKNFLMLANLAETEAPNLPLDHLVLLLGKRRAWSIAVAAFLLTQIDNEWVTPAMRQVATLGREQGIKALASAKLADEDAPEQAYISGLFSVIGLLPLIDICLEEIPDWVGISGDAIRKQQELFGTDCVELGHWIRLLWHVPLESKDKGKKNALGGLEDSASLTRGKTADHNRIVVPKGPRGSPGERLQ